MANTFFKEHPKAVLPATFFAGAGITSGVTWLIATAIKPSHTPTQLSIIGGMAALILLSAYTTFALLGTLSNENLTPEEDKRLYPKFSLSPLAAIAGMMAAGSGFAFALGNHYLVVGIILAVVACIVGGTAYCPEEPSSALPIAPKTDS